MSGHAGPLAERRASHRGREANMVHPPDSTGQSGLWGAGEETAKRALLQNFMNWSGHVHRIVSLFSFVLLSCNGTVVPVSYNCIFLIL